MPNTLVLHPTNGTTCFGNIPEKSVGKTIVYGAPIVLKVGKHGERGGFGIRHIWARHENELCTRGFNTVGDVPKFVAQIVQPGSPIYFESDNFRKLNITIIRATSGIAILEYFQNEHHYSVVTAYLKRQAHGTRIGSVGS